MFLDIFVHTPKCAGGTIQEHIENQYPSEERFGPHNPYYKERISQALGIVARWQCMKNPAYVKRNWINSYLVSLSPAQRDAIRCIYGHAAYYGIHKPFGREPRYFTFLREPLARFVSYYNYIRTVRVTPERLVKNEIQNKDGSFRSVDEWLEKASLNLYSMSGFFLRAHHAEKILVSFSDLGAEVPSAEDVTTIKKMLESFYFVGLTENKDDVEFTLRQLGITSRLPDRNVLSTRNVYLKPANPADASKVVAERCPSDVELYDYAVQLNREKKAQLPEYDTAAR